MTDDENDTRYPHDPYGVNRQKFPVENVGYPRNSYTEVDDNDDDDNDEGIDNEEREDNDDDDDDDDDGGNSVQRIGKDDYEGVDEDDNDDDYGDLKHPKKRKLKTLLSNYEFAPRVPASSSAPKPSHGGRNPLTDWTEHETFVLLDAWGDRFLKQGRKSLRSEEWQEVAEKVSHESKIERTDTQCRNRLDTLKKKYKKEKTKPGGPTNWPYFKKMDSLLSSPLGQQQAGISCGVDSGEYVFMNPRVYLNRSNGLDEMRDSPGDSESFGGEEDESESVLPKRTRTRDGRGPRNVGSFKLLADSIQRFSDVYKKTESCKREQMVELEKMRMEFHRDLEMQKREILDRARAEIEKIRRGDNEGNDVSG